MATPRFPWGVLVLSAFVVAVVGTGKLGVEHLATWKKAYLICACVLLVSALALDALARRRRK